MRVGFAGRLAAAFINSKLTPVIILASLLLGVFAVLRTAREEEPQIIVPMIDVMVSMPGATAKEVEQRISIPMEQLIWEIPGVEYVYTISSPGQSMAIVRFYVGQNQEASLVKLREKLMSHADIIPPGASQPLIRARSIDDVPILAVTLHSPRYDDYELRLLATRVADAVKQVPDVAETTIIGGRRRELRVILNRDKLAGFHLAPDMVAQAISTANQRASAGSFSDNNDDILVRSGKFLRTPADAANLVVGSVNGRPIFLKDVATVVDGPSEASNYVLFGRGPAWKPEGAENRNTTTVSAIEPAVTISVAKRPGTNAIDIANRVLAKIDSLKGSIIPSDVEATVTRNYGDTASEKSNDLLFHMMIAVVSVTLLIAITLGWRESLVVAIAIPVTLALTLLVFYLYGYTLNRITLFALIFSIGILVDDAIVVVENIVRHYRLPVGERRPPLEAAIHAVDEVGNPTILATFTVIAAVLPMALVSGLMGPYMRPIPIGSSAAMLFSLAIAFIVTPWAAYRLLRGEALHVGDGHKRPSFIARFFRSNEADRTAPPTGGAEGPHCPDPRHLHERNEGWMARFFRATTEPLLHSWPLRWAFLGSIAAMLIGAVALIGYRIVIVKMLPFDNKNEFQIIVDMPNGTTLEQTAAATRALANYIATVPEVKDYQMYVGTASPFNFNGLVRHYFTRRQPYQGDIQVNLIGKHERKAQSHDIVKRIRPDIARIAKQWGVRVKVAEVPPGPPVLETLVAEIYGPTDEGRARVAAQIKKIFQTTPGVTDVDWYMDDDQPTYQFTVDKEKAALNGVDTEAVNRTLAMSLGGAPIGLAHDEHAREDVPIVVQLPRAQRSGLRRLEQIYVAARDGHLVPIKELVRPVPIPMDKTIYHKNLLPVVYVTGDVTGRQESPVYAMLAMNKAIAKLRLPEGYKLNVLTTHLPETTNRYQMKWDGEWQITYEVFRDLGIAFAAVMVLIYILVVGWFQSFRTPFIIMAPIPLTLIGILPAHALLGAFFTATSMIGFIAGAGIMVRNSIILVDFIELRLRQGMTLEEAVIDAGIVRFRPMLLTASAVVVGAIVILFDPIFQGLAISLMAGGVTSTLLSRPVVPILYYMMRAREKELKQEAPFGRPKEMAELQS